MQVQALHHHFPFNARNYTFSTNKYKSNDAQIHLRHLPSWTIRYPMSPSSSSTTTSSKPFQRKRNRKRAVRAASSNVEEQKNVEEQPNVEEQKNVSPPTPPRSPQLLWRRFLKVAAPYWSSDDKAQARLQLATVFALTLGTTGISVGFNFLGRDFYNALANKDADQFTKQLLYYLGAFAVGIPFFVLRDYTRETLSLRWRSWMTKYYMQRYLENRTFYKIQSQSIIDNPDQRIVDDLSSFTSTALSFSLILFNAAVDLISFSNILFGIYPPLFVVLLVYSIGGTAISVYLGKSLVNLNFLQEKKEADFRYGLVRVRENAESIAFYGGEDNELQLLLQRFNSAFQNLTQLLIASRNLEFFTSGYRYLIQILPVAVVAPMYFSGKIEFGVINQSVSAFNHILGDFSLIVYQFQSISAFSAVVDRLGGFDDILESNITKPIHDSAQEIHLVYHNIKDSNSLDSNGSSPVKKLQALLDVQNLTLETPTSKYTLIRNLSLQINVNDHLLVMGPSGSGKTSLLRAMAGLWNSGRGKITFYLDEGTVAQPSTSANGPTHEVNSDGLVVKDFEGNAQTISRSIFFLPQRPYMNLGTLRQQLLYPTWAACIVPESDSAMTSGMLPFLAPEANSENVHKTTKVPTTDELLRVLKEVRLDYILSRFNDLDSTYEWSSVLSLGEQQRLAFARLLLSRPKLALLDESTSALDEANEAHLYQLIKAAGITYVSIGHRRTLCHHHNRVLYISTVDAGSNDQNWYIESIDEDIMDRLSKL